MISVQVYIVCLGCLVAGTTGVAYRAFSERHRRGTRVFGALMSAMSIWAFFYLLEIVLPELPQKIIARKILYLGMTLSAPLWLAFALRYTSLGDWWSQHGRVALLALPGFITFLFGLTNEAHHLIWKSFSIPEGSKTSPLQITYGTGFWIHAVIAYMLITAGFVIYISIYFRSPKYFRTQTGIMALGAIAPAIVNAVFLTGVLPTGIDPTPLSFALSAPLFATGFFRFGVFNLSPIAASVIVENLRDAIIVVDAQDNIVNTNLAARKRFNLQTRGFMGASVFNALPKPELFKEKWDVDDAKIKMKTEAGEQALWYDASITHIYKNMQTLFGRVIVFHDITREHELLETEFSHSVRMGLLEDVGRQIADSFTENEILQRTLDALINHFGYVEAAISLLVEENKLEVAAIAGTQDFGYKIKYKQELGRGIIGYTAKTQATYISKEVDKDPHYFSNETHYGSAIGVPLIDEKSLLGVLYVESARPNAFTSNDIQTLETLARQVAAAVQRARLYANTQEHLRVMSAVQSISRVVSSSLDLETICANVVNVLNLLFGYTYISIYLLENNVLKMGGQIGYHEHTAIDKIHISQGVSGRTIETRKTQFIQDVTQDANFLRAAPDVTSEICVPLLKEDTVLGTLNVEGKIDSPLTQRDANLLTTLSGPIALAVDNARLHAQVKRLAMTDAVTGLYNRHIFEETLGKEIERAARTDTSVSLIIFDLDSFKEYNDKWGHPAGDDRLRAIAELIRSSLRKYDVAARYGGDEFAIILPDTDHDGALLFAKRLLKSAQDSAPELLKKKAYAAGYTLSIGVASFPQHGKMPASLLLSADHAELVAKRLGKNRIISTDEDDE
jgi:diguanylate cyclase (GGDEF)-like protein